MDYVDAMMERGAARQELLNGLKHRVMEREEVRGRLETQAVLSEAIAQHLLRQEEIRLPNYVDPDAYDFFTNELLPAITAFARTKEEEDSMLGTLLTWINQSFVGHFANKLLVQENHQPDLLFVGDDRQRRLV